MEVKNYNIMEPLKFKAWVEEYKEMCIVLSIDFTNNDFYVLPFSELEHGSQVRVSGINKIKQFSGFLDKNGKEIYLDSDILKLPNGELALLLMDYGQLSSYFARLDRTCIVDLYGINNIQSYYLDQCEIVGNTNVNLEFLRGKI